MKKETTTPQPDSNKEVLQVGKIGFFVSHYRDGILTKENCVEIEKLLNENQRVKDSNLKLVQALEGVLNNINGNGDVTLHKTGRVLGEIKIAINNAKDINP